LEFGIFRNQRVRLQDVSDRVYQGQVYALLDHAQTSIVISMYLIRPGEDDKHPVNRLLKDLVEAGKRGVEVTIYLNTKFKERGDPQKWKEGPWFEKLHEAGVVVKLVSPVRRLHDKLVIVDRRIVVEGSMNWSVSAIADNFESATIIESPELAEAKLKRISFFPIWGEEEKKVPVPRRVVYETFPLFPAGAPTSLDLPAAFLEERRYFPKMIQYQRARAMKMFLLFLYLAQARGALKFSFSPEAAGEFLGILPGRDRSAVRRQIIRVLRDLQNLDGLLKAEFLHARETWVELYLPSGPVFTVGSDVLQAGELAVLTDNEIFLRLIKARLLEEGRRLEDLNRTQIKKRFFIGEETIGRTLGPAPRRGRPPAKPKTGIPVSPR